MKYKVISIKWSPESQGLQQQTSSKNGCQMPETLQVHLRPSMFLQSVYAIIIKKTLVVEKQADIPIKH
jgi:hypothetical protein